MFSTRILLFFALIALYGLAEIHADVGCNGHSELMEGDIKIGHRQIGDDSFYTDYIVIKPIKGKKVMEMSINCPELINVTCLDILRSEYQGGYGTITKLEYSGGRVDFAFEIERDTFSGFFVNFFGFMPKE